MPGRDELRRELVAIGTEHDLPVYRVTGLLNHASAAAGANHPTTMRRVAAEALDLACTYRMPKAIGVAEVTLVAGNPGHRNAPVRIGVSRIARRPIVLSVEHLPTAPHICDTELDYLSHWPASARVRPARRPQRRE